MTLSQVLARLRGPQPDLGRYRIGSAGFDDEVGYGRLGEQFEEAVRVLSGAHGTPVAEGYVSADLDVEKAVCWGVGEREVYAALGWEDNTRLRTLTLGCRRRGDLRAAPPPADWWALPPL